MRIVRLAQGDVALAKAMFAMMAEVFEEPRAELADAYVAALLARTELWALAALEDDDVVVGGLTAHALPLTRLEGSEIFLYDLAVRVDRQRRGIGRRLVTHLREEAGAAYDNVWVPADDEDEHALDFYRALGGEAAPVTIFTFPALRTRSPG